MTKITSQGIITHGISNDNNLWVWGDSVYADTDTEIMNTLYEGEVTEGKPMRMKWFKEKSLQVLDVSSSLSKAIVKTKDKDGNIIFYALQMEDTN